MTVYSSPFFSFPFLHSTLGERALPSFSILQQKIAKIAIVIFVSLSTCYALIRVCGFKVGDLFSEPNQFDVIKKDPILPSALNALNHFESLHKRMGRLRPKYQPTEDELKKLEEVKLGKDILFNPSFAERFSEIKTVPDFFKVSFADALKKIFSLVEKDKIQLNRSSGTPTSKGGFIVYRFLVLDWIKEGKLVKTCQRYELWLNNQEIKLISSLPEHVLKLQTIDGMDQPVIAIQFGARCDFIPGEEVLKYTSSACGIDPIGAKCLWEKLNQEARRHFLNWILEPGMEDDCPDYVAALDFIKTLSIREQKELSILRDLIDDLAVALEAKFKHTIAMIEWQPYLKAEDLELQPFVKKGIDSMMDMQSEKNKMNASFFTAWQLQENVLSDKEKEGIAKQNEFYQLIKHSKSIYQIYFNSLKPEFLCYPMASKTIISSISMEQLEQQYYLIHRIMRNHGCLLSNFLAMIVVKKRDINSKNVDKLKIAMAAYLDIPDHASEFEIALKNDFGCSITKFKNWLRRKDHFLDDEDLTSTVLEIAAHTLGVRVALFSPSSKASDPVYTRCEADEYGRIVPVKEFDRHYLGPTTQEIVFMAVEDRSTFYGLFPKMKIENMNASTLGISQKEWEIMLQLDQYYSGISENP